MNKLERVKELRKEYAARRVSLIKFERTTFSGLIGSFVLYFMPYAPANITGTVIGLSMLIVLPRMFYLQFKQHKAFKEAITLVNELIEEAHRNLDLSIINELNKFI